MALADWRAGRVAEAERACRHILVIDARHAQILHLLGLIGDQPGSFDEAIADMRNTITRNRRDPVFHDNLDNILK